MLKQDQKLIRLTLPYTDYRERENIEKVLSSGFLTQGPMVAEFEEKIKKYLGVKYAFATTSGTSALTLALLSVQKGKVYCPAFTFPASANVAIHVGNSIQLVDICLEDYNIDIEELKKHFIANSLKNEIIMPVHLFGYPAKINEILKMETTIVEDAACAIGSQLDGRFLGTFGDVGCFSMHPRKVLAVGEGGLLVTNNDEIAEKAKMFRDHGKVSTKDAFRYTFKIHGYNFRWSDLQAAVGLAQLEKLDGFIIERQHLAEKYRGELQDFNDIILPPKPDSNIRWNVQAFVVRIRGDVNKRNKLIETLKTKYWIETGIGTFDLWSLPIFSKDNYRENSNSKIAYETTLALPMYNGLLPEEVEYISESLREALKEVD